MTRLSTTEKAVMGAANETVGWIVLLVALCGAAGIGQPSLFLNPAFDGGLGMLCALGALCFLCLFRYDEERPFYWGSAMAVWSVAYQVFAALALRQEYAAYLN